jgi:hypothetical protein
VCLVPCDKEISQQGRKISLIRRDDLDEDSIRRQFVHGLLARIMQRLAKSNHIAFIRRKRNPTRSIGLQKLREIGDAKFRLSGLPLHVIFSLSARRMLSRPRASARSTRSTTLEFLRNTKG